MTFSIDHETAALYDEAQEGAEFEDAAHIAELKAQGTPTETTLTAWPTWEGPDETVPF